MGFEYLENEIEKLKDEVNVLYNRFTASAHSKSGGILEQLSKKRALLSEKQRILEHRKLEESYKALKSESAGLKARLEKAVELPCKVGDTVYVLDLGTVSVHKAVIIPCSIDEFVTTMEGTYAVLNGKSVYIDLRRFKAVNISNFGKNVFLLREEAQANLEEMKAVQPLDKTVSREKIKSFLKRFLLVWFISIGIYITITIIWGFAEMKIYGHTKPNDIDSAVTFILTVLIFDRLKIKINA